MAFTVFVRNICGSHTRPVDINTDPIEQGGMTVGDLRQAVQTAFQNDNGMRIIVGGVALDDDSVPISELQLTLMTCIFAIPVDDDSPSLLTKAAR